jgi:hypothetical protein
MKSKLAEALMTLSAVAVVARVVWGLLGHCRFGSRH